ncbi:hypothetical protein OAQ84_01565 [Bdellovibrionales bacterium]|nr:hypothetical protein [Bdellovibrionales bacterium]
MIKSLILSIIALVLCTPTGAIKTQVYQADTTQIPTLSNNTNSNEQIDNDEFEFVDVDKIEVATGHGGHTVTSI